MSKLVANAIQLGQSPTPTNNFGLAVPTVPDGSIRLQRGNVGGAIEDLLTISAAGIVSTGYNPATGLRSTAIATMQKFADEFGSLLSTNGWQKLPSGLIVQWGTATIPASGTSTSSVTAGFPIAFPNAALNAVAVAGGNINTGTGGVAPIRVTSLTTLNMNLNGDCNGFTTFNQTCPVRWVAFGY